MFDDVFKPIGNPLNLNVLKSKTSIEGSILGRLWRNAHLKKTRFEVNGRYEIWKFKFNGLPLGLKTSSNSFHLLKNKVLNGLSFRNALYYLDDVGGVLKNFKSLRDYIRNCI
jgi:hypothetical protein